MLLKHTPREIVERSALTINPAKTCMPIGAMYAALGIHACLPHSHGSQGCCAYHRSTLTRHTREPVMAATSSFTEGTSVFGGQANLLTAIENIFTIYNPDVIAVHTTCLSETIGDDMTQILTKAREDGKVPDGKYVVAANTPSYVGSHITGFARMTLAMVNAFAETTERQYDQVNIIPGWVEPSDVRELKRLAAEMHLPCILFPDVSDVLDTPQTGKMQMYPKGGTTVEQLRRAGNSVVTLGLGPSASTLATQGLDAKCKVQGHVLELPIGLRATDRFIGSLRRINGGFVPESITEERGRLVDVITDWHQYFHGKKVALFGDPDQLVPLSEFLLDLDMLPRYVLTGTPGKSFEERMQKVLGDRGGEVLYKQGMGADQFYLHQLIKNERPDLLIGTTHGKYIARDEDLPFLRFGFPILDRCGHTYFPSVGYRGALRILEKLLDLILERKDRDATEEQFELVL
jgi:nitrogenase molybdenum-iron protein beta chain